MAMCTSCDWYENKGQLGSSYCSKFRAFLSKDHPQNNTPSGSEQFEKYFHGGGTNDCPYGSI